MPHARGRRLRPAGRRTRLLRRHAPAIALLGLVLLAGGAWASHAAWTKPERDTHAVETWRFEAEAAYAYRVPVTRENGVWANGTVLPMGLPGYFRTASERVEVSFAWRALTPADATGVVQADMALVVRAEAPDGRAYWTITRPLAEASSAAPGRGVTLDGVLDLDALTAEIANATTGLEPRQGKVRWSLVSTVRFAGDADGRRVTNVTAYALPFDVDDPLVVLPAVSDVRWTPSQVSTRTVVVTREAGAAGLLAAPLRPAALLLGAALVAAAATARLGDPLRRASRADVAFVREWEEHAAWVTVPRAGVPDPARGIPCVDLGSLAEMTDAAMEARTRVLLDEPRRTYWVLTAGLVYRYVAATPRERRRAAVFQVVAATPTPAPVAAAPPAAAAEDGGARAAAPRERPKRATRRTAPKKSPRRRKTERRSK